MSNKYSIVEKIEWAKHDIEEIIGDLENIISENKYIEKEFITVFDKLNNIKDHLLS